VLRVASNTKKFVTVRYNRGDEFFNISRGSALVVGSPAGSQIAGPIAGAHTNLCLMEPSLPPEQTATIGLSEDHRLKGQVCDLRKAEMETPTKQYQDVNMM
jgi:hypothetical protein